jgi:hypothetical protein
VNVVDWRRFGIAVVAATVAATTLLFGLNVSGSDDPGGTPSSVAATAGTPMPVVTDASDPRWPTSIANRKVLDQYGDVYLIRTFSSWGMASNLSDTDVTSALEGLAANGFNGVTVWIGGGAYYGEDWSPTYQHKATSQAFWNGTPWASALGPAWASLDHLVAEAERLGIFVWMSLDGGLGVPRADWEAVTTTDMYNTGVAVATRYLSAPNVGWHVMIDDTSVTTGGTVGQRIDAFFHGVNDTEGASARPVRWLEVGGGSSTNEQGWLGTTNVNATINSWYEFGNNSTEIAEAGYAEVPTVPVGDCEPPYDGAPHYGADADQQLRERSYTTFLEGGSLINYGHEDWWRFGLSGLYTEGLTWQQVQGHSHTVQQSYAWKLLDEFVADPTWAPDDGSFLTTGTGNGDTKAAAGRSDTAAIAYLPSSRDVVVNTTVLGGNDPVRLRWYDPTAGTYTIISASEARQNNRSVAYPAAHPDGRNDWVLVVDLATGTTTTAPTAPRSLTAHRGDRTVRLTWLAPSTNGGAPITDYIVQRSADNGRTWRTVNDGVSTAHIVTVSGLTNGHRYRFRVAAVNEVGRGPWSAAVSAVPATVPGAPRRLTATAAYRAVKLTWLSPRSNGGAPITDYIVQRSVDNGRTWRTVPDGVSIRRAATVNGLRSGKRYTFRVSAKNPVGRGAMSAPVSMVPR